MAIENIGLYPITIDVYKKHKETTVQANDNDSNGRGLLITLVKDGIPFNSTGINLKIGFRNAVGEERLYDCDIVDVLTGKYKVFYPTEMLQGNGGRVVKLEIKAFEANGALLNYSPVFVYVNRAEISNDAIGGTNETSTLVNALSQVQNIDNRFNSVNAQLAEKLTESNIATFYLMSAVTAISPIGATDDMSVIKTMDNKIIVIDCGETSNFNYYDDKLTKMGVSKVDYFLVTHSHSDHIGNAPELIAKYKPTHLYCREVDWNRLETESIQPEKEWRTKQFHIGMVNAAIANGVIIHHPTSGDVISLNNHEDIKIVYDPIIDYNDYNNASMAFLYRNDLIKVLFLGDQLNKATNKLMSEYGKVDAVKLGHHGTAGTSNFALLNALKPKMAFLNSQDITRANDTCNRVRFFGVPYTNKDNEIIMFSISGNTITHNLKEYDNLNKQFKYWDGVDVDEYYFVKSNGKLAKDEFILDGFDLKYFSETEQLWTQVGFRPVENTYYYHLSDGTLAKNRWVLHTDGKYYYLKSDYKMAVSEQLWINGVVYTFDAAGNYTPI